MYYQYFQKQFGKWFLLFCCLTLPKTIVQAEDIEPILKTPAWVFETEGEFKDVKESLLMAIQGRGLVISATSHASDMFDRTAESVGAKKRTYSKAESLFFCSSVLSHKMIAEDPHALILCPYTISIYGLEDKPGIIYLSIHKPVDYPKSYAPIHQLLVEIIAETISF